MSFVRPEIARALRRWREPILWGATLIAGLWLASGPGTGLTIVGLALALAGGLLLRPAIRRARAGAGGEGAGVVEIRERQLTYMSAGGGGLLSLDAIVEVRIDGGRWHLVDGFGNHLSVPIDALGGDRLRDTLVLLPDMDGDRLFAAIERGEGGRIWPAGSASVPRLPRD